MKGIQRRVPNKPTMEIYEEDMSDDEDDEGEIVEDEQDFRHKLNLKVRSKSFAEGDARSRLNERFNQNIGKMSSQLKSRLGGGGHNMAPPAAVEAAYDSGDSLERDTGEDLNRDGDTANMVIQVSGGTNQTII
jgi:hypothetical protein